MLISIAVSDAVIRIAQEKGQSVEDFVEAMIDKGMKAMGENRDRPLVSDAMQRIRALHEATLATKR
jgi:hypothetical protein